MDLGQDLLPILSKKHLEEFLQLHNFQDGKTRKIKSDFSAKPHKNILNDNTSVLAALVKEQRVLSAGNDISILSKKDSDYLFVNETPDHINQVKNLNHKEIAIALGDSKETSDLEIVNASMASIPPALVKIYRELENFKREYNEQNNQLSADEVQKVRQIVNSPTSSDNAQRAQVTNQDAQAVYNHSPRPVNYRSSWDDPYYNDRRDLPPDYRRQQSLPPPPPPPPPPPLSLRNPPQSHDFRYDGYYMPPRVLHPPPPLMQDPHYGHDYSHWNDYNNLRRWNHPHYDYMHGYNPPPWNHCGPHCGYANSKQPLERNAPVQRTQNESKITTQGQTAPAANQQQVLVEPTPTEPQGPEGEEVVNASAISEPEKGPLCPEDFAKIPSQFLVALTNGIKQVY